MDSLAGRFRRRNAEYPLCNSCIATMLFTFIIRIFSGFGFADELRLSCEICSNDVMGVQSVEYRHTLEVKGYLISVSGREQNC